MPYDTEIEDKIENFTHLSFPVQKNDDFLFLFKILIFNVLKINIRKIS